MDVRGVGLPGCLGAPAGRKLTIWNTSDPERLLLPGMARHCSSSQVLQLRSGHSLDVILHSLPQGQHHLHQLGVDAAYLRAWPSSGHRAVGVSDGPLHLGVPTGLSRLAGTCRETTQCSNLLEPQPRRDLRLAPGSFYHHTLVTDPDWLEEGLPVHSRAMPMWPQAQTLSTGLKCH